MMPVVQCKASAMHAQHHAGAECVWMHARVAPGALNLSPA